MKYFKQIVFVLLVVGFSAASTQVVCAKPRLQKFLTEKVEISRLEDWLSRAVITVGGAVFLIHMILGPVDVPRYLRVEAPHTSERISIDLYKVFPNSELSEIMVTDNDNKIISFPLEKAHPIAKLPITDSDATKQILEVTPYQPGGLVELLKNTNKENSEFSADTIVEGIQLTELKLNTGYHIVKVDNMYYLVDENNIVH